MKDSTQENIVTGLGTAGGLSLAVAYSTAVSAVIQSAFTLTTMQIVGAKASMVKAADLGIKNVNAVSARDLIAISEAAGKATAPIAARGTIALTKHTKVFKCAGIAGIVLTGAAVAAAVYFEKNK